MKEIKIEKNKEDIKFGNESILVIDFDLFKKFKFDLQRLWEISFQIPPIPIKQINSFINEKTGNKDELFYHFLSVGSRIEENDEIKRGDLIIYSIKKVLSL